MIEIITIKGVEYERDGEKEIAKLLERKAKEDAKKVKKEG